MLSTMVTISLAGICWRMVRVDVIAERGGLFNARAGARAHVNLELSRIDGGKEVLPEPWREQPDRCQRKDQEARSERRAA